MARQAYERLVSEHPKDHYAAYAEGALGFLEFEGGDAAAARAHFTSAAKSGADPELVTEALERSGGDGRRLTVEQALKIAIPVTCLIITLFAAPLVVAAPRASGAVGVAVGLGTTLMFLLSVNLSQAVGGGGILPPVVAAWTPNVLFCIAGLWFLKRART